MLCEVDAAASDLVPDTFELHSGADVLRRYFRQVEVTVYHSDLLFPDFSTLERFVLTTNARERLQGESLEAFRNVVTDRAHWPVRIATEVGLLAARWPSN
jgi:hypothetical protein